MNAKTFFDKVARMREAQKEYYRTRGPAALKRSISLEAEIDQEIKRVLSIIETEKNQPIQTTLDL